MLGLSGLSKSSEGQGKLVKCGDQGRRFHRFVEPLGQLPVGKEVEAKHARQVGQRPVGLGEVMQPFEQEQGDQGCPNLDPQGVFAGTHEGLHGQVLLQGFEEQLDLPAFLVDGSDGGGAERQQVGEQNDFPLVVGIPNHHAPQQAGTVGLRLAPVSRMIWSARMLRSAGTWHSSTTS